MRFSQNVRFAHVGFTRTPVLLKEAEYHDLSNLPKKFEKYYRLCGSNRATRWRFSNNYLKNLFKKFETL